MFTIDDKIHEIKLTRGNSCEIDTTPFIQETKQPIKLGEGDKILFTVRSPSGKIYIKKILTNDDYDEDNNITIKLEPIDTINIKPFNYVYDLLLVFADGSAYTYVDTSNFIITQAVGTINDIEDIQNEVIDIVT